MLAVLGAGLTLTACTSVGTFSAPTQATTAKSLAVADTTFDSLTLAAEQGVLSGKLKGSDAGQARVVLGKLHTALEAAHDAYAAGRTADVTARLTAFDDLRVQALRAHPAEALTTEPLSSILRPQDSTWT